MKKTFYQFISGIAVLTLTLVSVNSVSATYTEVKAQQTGNTYYVSPAGNDANACTLFAPCKTFSKVIGLAAAGDLVVALEGTYTEVLNINKSGITVEGIDAIVTASPQAIRVRSTAQNVTVRGFTVTGTESHGIYIEGQAVTVENNTVYHSVLENGALSNGSVTCGDSAWGSAIKVALGASNVTVRNNTVYENCGEGIAATRASNVVIEGNTVYDNKSVNIYVDNSFNVQVLNNNVHCSLVFPKGIALGEEYYSGWGAQLHDVLISGNVITNCHTGIIAFQSDVGGTLTNVTISNNNASTGQRRGISLDNSANSNVLVSNNIHFNSIWVRSPQGVTLTGNTRVSGTPSPEPSPTTSPATATPSFTPTATLVPSSTPAATQTPVPTFTETPSPTHTPEPTATSMPPTEDPTEAPTEPPVETPPPSAEVIYDNTDPNFIYSPEWVDVSNKKAYGKSYKETSSNAANVIFTFTGQSFSILYTGGPAFRNMDVYVDDVLIGSIDQRVGTRTFQMRWDYTGQLEPGQHTLKLVFVTNKANKTKGAVDAVIVR